MAALVELTEVSRTFGTPPVTAVANMSFTIEAGEFVAFVGPSGSGKSTLMNLIGSLDVPSTGSVVIDGIDVRKLSDAGLSALRARRIGFIFQRFHLAEGTTALDNVADGLLYSGVSRRRRRNLASTALISVGLGHRLDHRPHQLSGGEQQRVAIARAIVGNPPLVLADEPTGNLDTASGEAVINILNELNHEGTTVVVITHDNDLASSLPRRIALRDGHITSDVRTNR